VEGQADLSGFFLFFYSYARGVGGIRNPLPLHNVISRDNSNSRHLDFFIAFFQKHQIKNDSKRAKTQ